jgi:threonine synthase
LIFRAPDKPSLNPTTEMIFFCSACARPPIDPLQHYRCPDCFQALDCALESPATFPKDKIVQRAPTPWRYREALPDFVSALALGEVQTPLVPFEIDGHHLLLKCDHTQPTGSYKDRGSALLMAYLHRAGITTAAEDSSGNAGASLAAYAARAGIHLQVFCPASASKAKLAQIELYGAELVPVAGPRPRATESLLQYIEQSGTTYASHLWNPLFIFGIKTLAYEIAEQLNWRAPDAIICPVGAGSILLGLYAGFCDLLADGAVATMPQLVAVQARNVSPLYSAWSSQATEVRAAVNPAATRAEGIALPQPVRGQQLLAALHQSQGAVFAIDEKSIEEGVQALGRGGFCVEPTAAVVWKGAKEYWETSRQSGQTVVAVLSGHGLKALS